MPLNAETEYRFITGAEAGEVAELYREAGWWDEEYDTGFIPGMIAGSFCVAAVFIDGKMAGMARAVSDGDSDAYIQDVTVLRRFRGNGLGGNLVRMVIDKLREEGIDWIGLIAAPGTAEFYRKLGFDTMEGHTPMKYKT